MQKPAYGQIVLSLDKEKPAPELQPAAMRNQMNEILKVDGVVKVEKSIRNNIVITINTNIITTQAVVDRKD